MPILRITHSRWASGPAQWEHHRRYPNSYHINAHSSALLRKDLKLTSTATTSWGVSVFSHSSNCEARQQQVLRRMELWHISSQNLTASDADIASAGTPGGCALRSYDAVQAKVETSVSLLIRLDSLVIHSEHHGDAYIQACVPIFSV